MAYDQRSQNMHMISIPLNHPMRPAEVSGGVGDMIITGSGSKVDEPSRSQSQALTAGSRET